MDDKYTFNLDKDTVFERMIKYGLFPEKLKHIFTSENLWDQDFLKSFQNCSSTRKCTSCDVVQYKSYKSDNIERIMGIPNPFAYINASRCIKIYWDDIQNYLNKVPLKKISMITLDEHNQTGRMLEVEENYQIIGVPEFGRLFSMSSDQDESLFKIKLIDEYSLGAKYVVHADIAQCYPSIYTHVIGWVAVGREVAKQKKGDKKEWYNQLDEKVRKIRSEETNGLPIGSDVSAIIAEYVLSAVDVDLYGNDYKYIRHIDDFICYCETREKADEFISDLISALDKYRLKLNDKKTKILELPQPVDDDWIVSLRSLSHLDNDITMSNYRQFLNLIDNSIRIMNQGINIHAINYLYSVVKNKKFKNKEAFLLIMNRLLNITYYYPYTLDKIYEMLNENECFIEDTLLGNLSKTLVFILSESVNYIRSEAMTYCFFIAIMFDLELEIGEDFYKKLLNTNDYVSILMAYLYRKKNHEDINSILDSLDKDNKEAWLLHYQVSFYEGTNAGCLEFMRTKGITFLSSDLHEKIKNESKKNKA